MNSPKKFSMYVMFLRVESFSSNFMTSLRIDGGQITHLIRVRLKILLYDFFGGGGVLAFLFYPPLFLSCARNYICFWRFPVQAPQGMFKTIRKLHITLKLV